MFVMSSSCLTILGEMTTWASITPATTTRCLEKQQQHVQQQQSLEQMTPSPRVTTIAAETAAVVAAATASCQQQQQHRGNSSIICLYVTRRCEHYLSWGIRSHDDSIDISRASATKINKLLRWELRQILRKKSIFQCIMKRTKARLSVIHEIRYNTASWERGVRATEII